MLICQLKNKNYLDMFIENPETIIYFYNHSSKNLRSKINTKVTITLQNV